MSDENIHKDQLLAEHQFISFCNDDYVGSGKRLNVTPEFLEAAKRDRLIKPLLSETVTEQGTDGSNVKRNIDYYSPHQLTIMVGLRKNVIKDGKLSSKEPMAWAAVPTRTVLWGDRFGYTVNDDTGKPLGLPNNLDVPKIVIQLHSFLQLLHSQPQTRDYDKVNQQRERHFTLAPKLQYVWDGIKGDPQVALRRYKLSIERLNLLRSFIGLLATELDPLEYWYYYLKRHPQWRKDDLKGDALLAQELYNVQDMLVDVLEIVSGGKQPPLLEFLHQGSSIRPFLIPLVEFVEGEDVAVLEDTVRSFEKWLSKPANKRLAPTNTVPELSVFKEHLQDYKDRYGNKSYKNGMHEVEYQSDYKLDDLDPDTRKHVEAVMKSYNNVRTDEAGKQYFTTSFHKELSAKGATNKDAVELDRQWQLQSEINMAIEHRLVDLKRQLWSILNMPDEVLRSNEEKAWANAQDISSTSADKQKYVRARRAAEGWGGRRSELGKIIKMRELIYCKRCRKNPVQQRYGQGDRQITTEPICDDCLSKTPALRQINEAPWKCDNCGRLIYKFANQNMLDDTLMGGSTATITLEFGRLEVKAKCKHCKHVSQRFIDWGWQP